jgi:biopolymer transport protein ExbD
MRAWPIKEKRQARIEIIPMIDVMMFLLVFFVLISINVLPALGLRIKPATSTNSDRIVEKTRLTVGIDHDGRTFLDGQPITLPELPERLKAATEPGKQLSVVIAGDGESSLQTLVDVMEAMKSAGVTSTQIVTKPVAASAPAAPAAPSKGP